MTNLIITDDATYQSVTARVDAWKGAVEIFGDEPAFAKDAAIEFTLNEMGLTVYTTQHDESLMTRMDEWFGNLPKEHRENWCESGVCGCMGCVNHVAYQNGVTKQQWRIWVLDRTPGLAEQCGDPDQVGPGLHQGPLRLGLLRVVVQAGPRLVLSFSGPRATTSARRR